jgi:hypothetical protein
MLSLLGNKHDVLALVMTTAGLVFASCGPLESTDVASNSRLSLQASALSSDELSDACYRVTVHDGDGGVVWSRDDLCASSFGVGTEIAYVGFCNASSPMHTASLELMDILDEFGTPLAADRFVNPCPPGQACEQAFECVENEDARVNFELTVLLDAEAGFVDTAVNVDYLECSGKLDCVDDDGEPLLLLHDENGDRGPTVVFGLSCNMEPCSDPGIELYFNTLVVRCAEGRALVDVLEPGPATIVQDAPILFGGTVFSGTGPFGGSLFHNVAIGFNGGTNCTAKFRATASDVPFPGGFIAESQPLLNWNVQLTNLSGEMVCGRNGLDEGNRVTTVYLPSQRLRNQRLFSALPDECDPLEP